MVRRVVAVTATAAALLLVGGCGAPAVPVDVAPIPATGQSAGGGAERAEDALAVCRSVLSDAPTWLGELARRDVRPASEDRGGTGRPGAGGDNSAGQAPDAADVAAAWGDPAAILRCGVTRPEAFRPSSACIRIEGVDWFAEEAERGYVFTTVGREVRIEVSVPDDYEPEADLLVDLASAIEENTRVHEPCV